MWKHVDVLLVRIQIKIYFLLSKLLVLIALITDTNRMRYGFTGICKFEHLKEEIYMLHEYVCSFTNLSFDANNLLSYFHACFIYFGRKWFPDSTHQFSDMSYGIHMCQILRYISYKSVQISQQITKFAVHKI